MLGERIRDARHASGLSLAAVAERAEISAATLSRIERNKQALDLGLFLVLAAIVRVTPSELLAGTDQDSGNGDELVRRLAAMKTEERNVSGSRMKFTAPITDSSCRTSKAMLLESAANGTASRMAQAMSTTTPNTPLETLAPRSIPTAMMIEA